MHEADFKVTVCSRYFALAKLLHIFVWNGNIALFRIWGKYL